MSSDAELEVKNDGVKGDLRREPMPILRRLILSPEKSGTSSDTSLCVACSESVVQREGDAQWIGTERHARAAPHPPALGR